MLNENKKNVENVIRMMEKDDITWYKQILKNAPYGNSLSESEQLDFIKKAMEEAETVKNDLSQFNLNKPIEYINHFNINLDFVNDKQSWGYQYLGMFKHRSKTIVINNVAMDTIVQKMVIINRPYLNTKHIKDVAIMHEFFHYMEEKYPDSFTKQKHVNIRLLGIFKTKATISILREIAAIHFSKITTGVPHSPVIYQKIYNLKL